MRLFVCDACGNSIHFDNTGCLRCGRRLGFRPETLQMVSLTMGPDPAPNGAAAFTARDGTSHVFCANVAYDACNWLLPQSAAGERCPACRHNSTVPDLTIEANLGAFRRFTRAERHLFWSLKQWGLPTPTRAEAPTTGLAFDFLCEEVRPDGAAKPVLTGHSDGVITLAAAEADDAERESRRTALGEPYRTLLGHFRHEIGHYYWDRLVRDGGRIEACRALFGDERADYAEALRLNYEQGPPSDWPLRFISTYAACHPWEDFAETWAHYLHIVDALETALAFGVALAPLTGDDQLRLDVNFQPYSARTIDDLVAAWVPLTVAMNAINRSMGQPDLYPFVLSTPVVAKLGFVHALIHGTA